MANWLRNTTYATLLALSMGCGGNSLKTDIPRNDAYSSQEDLETILDDVQINNDVLSEDVNLNDIYVKNDLPIKEDLETSLDDISDVFVQGEDVNLDDIYNEDSVKTDYKADLNLDDNEKLFKHGTLLV